MSYVIGALSAALLLVIAYHAAYVVASRQAVRLAMARETRALDAAHAAELRSAQQIDAMLDRISTAPRLELQPDVQIPPVSDEPAYISDEPYHDAEWNKYRGIEDDAE